MEATELFGSSVSLSAEGNTIAISGNNVARIYKNVNDIWIQTGIDIDGLGAGVYSQFVSLSADGTTVALGEPHCNGQRGRVRVYDLSLLSSSDSYVASNFSIYPNPVSNLVNINLNSDLELQKVNIYSISGQLIATEMNRTFKIDNLSKGTYFVEVVTSKGSATKSILVK